MLKRFMFSLVLLVNLLAVLPAGKASAQDNSPLVLALSADGPVTPAMVAYLQRGLRQAEQRQAELLVFQLNTPGGNLTLMNEIVQLIRGSWIPVVVYVAPRGAQAGSAGAIITLAGHIAAMAPETVIGAASPVGGQGEDIDETMARKVKEDMKSTVRSVSERRSPEAVALAEDMIENARAVTAQEALDIGLIDFIADTLDDLLSQMDGYQVETIAGERTLQTASAQVESISSSLFEQVLATLTDPNIVFLLLNIGVFAVLIELSSPGGWIAGFIGVVSLALAMYAMGVLPVNWFGLVFLVTAFVLFLLDIKAPTHGALTAAGVASLIVGALILFNSTGSPAFGRVSVPLVVGSSLFMGGIFLGFLLFALRAQTVPIRMGQESLVGRTGVARTELAPGGLVQLGGEQWSARLYEGQPNLPKGARVEVVRVDGLKLIVRAKSELEKGLGA